MTHWRPWRRVSTGVFHRQPWLQHCNHHAGIERDTSGTKQCSVTTTCITSGQSGISALTQITVPENDPDACNAIINNIRRENPGCDVTSDCC